MKAYKTCTTKKDNRHKEYGTAVRIHVAELPWQEILLDFITDLPVKCNVRTDEGYAWENKRAECILMCCDKITKIRFKHLPNVNRNADAHLLKRFTGCMDSLRL